MERLNEHGANRHCRYCAVSHCPKPGQPEAFMKQEDKLKEQCLMCKEMWAGCTTRTSDGQIICDGCCSWLVEEGGTPDEV